MNTTLADQQGVEPIQPLLQKVAALDDKARIASLVADIQARHLGSPFFTVGSQQDLKDSTQQIGIVRQGGLTLPDRDYYI